MSEELLGNVAEALESLDADRLTAFYAEDAVFEDTGADLIARGHEQIRAYFTQLFSLPAVRFDVLTHFGDDSWGAAEWLWYGQSRSAGTPFTIRGASVFELDAELIARETIYYDPSAWRA